MLENGATTGAATARPACETAPNEAGPIPAFCALCGQAGRGWASVPGGAVSHYRCEACYRRLPDGAIFCIHCGRAANHGEAATWLVRHAGAGRFCAAAGPRGVARPITDGELPGFENIRDVGKLYGTLLGVILLRAAMGHLPEGNGTELDFYFSAAMYAATLAFAWPWRSLLLPLCRWPQGDRRLLLLVPLTPVLTLAAVQGQLLLVSWLGWPVVSYVQEFAGDGYGFGAAFLWVAILPAIFEEIAFRGLLLGKLGLVMAPPQAILVTSLLFAIVHFNLLGMLIFLVPLAYMAGWLTLKTKSLLPAMLVHLLHNGGVLCLEYLYP